MTNQRLEKFRGFKEHAWLHKSFKKLTAKEIELSEAFLVANLELSRGEFELKVNRMFLDKPKPAHWTVVLELLSNSNS